MHNEFEAIIERDGDWFVAYSPEIPGANGQGLTADEARQDLSEAIALILEIAPRDYSHIPSIDPEEQAKIAASLLRRTPEDRKYTVVREG